MFDKFKKKTIKEVVEVAKDELSKSAETYIPIGIALLLSTTALIIAIKAHNKTGAMPAMKVVYNMFPKGGL